MTEMASPLRSSKGSCSLASLLPLSREQDPLLLRNGEAISVIELAAGAASYLPLKSWRERELLQEGTDPVLGLLAALGKLPPDLRVIAQLALVLPSACWSWQCSGSSCFALCHCCTAFCPPGWSRPR